MASNTTICSNNISTHKMNTSSIISNIIKFKEQADADTDNTAYGQLWVKTATPNQLYFTTDAGDDIALTSGTSIAGAGSINIAGAVSIDSTANSITMGSVLTDGQTLKLGKNGATEMIFTPHGTPSNETITLTNTVGDDAAAIALTSTAGGITQSFVGSTGLTHSGDSGGRQNAIFKTKAVDITVTTTNSNQQISNFFPGHSIPLALTIKVTSAISNTDHIIKVGTYDDVNCFNPLGDLGDNVLEQVDDMVSFTSGVYGQGGLSTFATGSIQHLLLSYNGTPTSGAVTATLYYMDLTNFCPDDS
jgi:hypothetical protein